jgi:hypothetical protein
MTFMPQVWCGDVDKLMILYRHGSLQPVLALYVYQEYMYTVYKFKLKFSDWPLFTSHRYGRSLKNNGSAWRVVRILFLSRVHDTRSRGTSG